MNKAKKILKIGGLLFVLPAIMAGICLMAIRPLDAKSGEVGFTAVSILGHVWMPWEQIPSGKVVTVDNDLYQIHTNDPVDEEAVREAAVAATEKMCIRDRSMVFLNLLDVTVSSQKRLISERVNCILLQRQSNQPISFICHEQRNVQHIVIQLQIVQREPHTELDLIRNSSLNFFRLLLVVLTSDLTSTGKISFSRRIRKSTS